MKKVSIILLISEGAVGIRHSLESALYQTYPEKEVLAVPFTKGEMAASSAVICGSEKRSVSWFTPSEPDELFGALPRILSGDYIQWLMAGEVQK